MKLAWSKWNSGGGCMIYNFNYASSDGVAYSIHVSDDCLIAVNISSVEYWSLETAEEQENQLLIPVLYWDEDRSISKELCPYTGQELADLIEADVQKMWTM